MEGGGGVSQSEEHYSWFEQSLQGFEGGFPFVALLDSDVVVSPSYVKLGKEGLSLELFQDCFDEGKWVIVTDRLFVQFLVILDRSKLSVFLFDEEEWCSVW